MDEASTAKADKKKCVQNSMSAILQMLNNPDAAAESSDSGDSESSNSGADFPVAVAPTTPVTIAPTLPVTVTPTLPVSIAPTLPVAVAPTLPVNIAPTLPVNIAPTLPVSVAPTTLPTENVITIPVNEVNLTPEQLSQIEAALTSEEGQRILETFADTSSFIVEDILEPIPSAICIPAQELDTLALQHTVAISTAASTDPKLESPLLRATNEEDSNEPSYYGAADHSYCSTALDQLEHESKETTSATSEAQVQYCVGGSGRSDCHLVTVAFMSGTD